MPRGPITKPTTMGKKPVAKTALGAAHAKELRDVTAQGRKEIEKARIIQSNRVINAKRKEKLFEMVNALNPKVRFKLKQIIEKILNTKSFTIQQIQELSKNIPEGLVVSEIATTLGFMLGNFQNPKGLMDVANKIYEERVAARFSK